MPGTPPASTRLLIPRIANADASDPAGHLNALTDRVDLVTRKLETRVTALPSTPQDGDVVVFATTAMAAKGVAWRLRYRAGASGPFKWEYIGGPEMDASNTAGNALTPAGSVWLDPSSGFDCQIAVPLAGDYIVTNRAQFYVTTGASEFSATYSAGIALAGAAPPSHLVAEVSWETPAIAGNYQDTCASFAIAEGLSVATYGQRYYVYEQVPPASRQVIGRRMSLTPIRVG